MKPSEITIDYLRDFGVRPDTESRGSRHLQRNVLSDFDFFEGAGQLLDEDKLPELVMDQVVPYLEEHHGEWHPSGFMVYRLGNHALYGSLRLHIWPQYLRQRQERGLGAMVTPESGLIYDGDIHNHSWYVISHNYTGYSDLMYHLDPCYVDEDEITPEELLESVMSNIYRLYRVSYDEKTRAESLSLRSLSPSGPNTRGWVSCLTLAQRTVGDNDLHIIYPGEFHSPAVPLGRLAATLVFNSHRVTAGGPDVLIRGDPGELPGRKRVSRDEAELAKMQLMTLPAEVETPLPVSVHRRLAAYVLAFNGAEGIDLDDLPVTLNQTPYYVGKPGGLHQLVGQYLNEYVQRADRNGGVGTAGLGVKALQELTERHFADSVSV